MSSIARALNRLPKPTATATATGIAARTIASTSSAYSPAQTLHTTNPVHSLGHSIEHASAKYATITTFSAPARPAQSEHKDEPVWCVAEASGRKSEAYGVPMGAFAVQDTFGPAWRRSL